MPAAGSEIGPLADGRPDRIAQPLPLAGIGIELGEDVVRTRVGNLVAQGPRPLAISRLDPTLLVQEHEHYRNVVHDPLQQLALLAPRVLDALALDRHRHL